MCKNIPYRDTRYYKIFANKLYNTRIVYWCKANYKKRTRHNPSFLEIGLTPSIEKKTIN